MCKPHLPVHIFHRLQLLMLRQPAMLSSATIQEVQALLTTGRGYCSGPSAYARGPCSGLEFGPGPNPDHPVPMHKLVVMGFPLEAKGGERSIIGEGGRGRMFEPGNLTGASHLLSTAGGPTFARFDVCSTPGIIKQKPGQPDDNKPDWPPRKDLEECLEVLPQVLQALPSPIVTEVRAISRWARLLISMSGQGVGARRVITFHTLTVEPSPPALFPLPLPDTREGAEPAGRAGSDPGDGQDPDLRPAHPAIGPAHHV